MVGHRCTDPHAGVVDQNVEAAEVLAVAGDDVLDLLLRGQVGRDLLDLVAGVAQLLRRAGELLGPAGGDGEAVALLAEHVRDRQPDAARGAGDEGCAVGHRRHATDCGAMSTPFTVALLLLAILLGAGFALDSGDARSPKRSKAEPPTPIATIERRVEAIRALRFESLPRPQTVSPAQAKRDGLEDLDRNYPATRRHADEEVLKLLGLLPATTDLRKLSGTIFGQGVAGYY